MDQGYIEDAAGGQNEVHVEVGAVAVEAGVCGTEGTVALLQKHVSYVPAGVVSVRVVQTDARSQEVVVDSHVDQDVGGSGGAAEERVKGGCGLCAESDG